MSPDAKAVIGTIVGTALVAAGLMLTQNAGLNALIDDLRTDLPELRATIHEDHERFHTRLNAVEVALGKVDQRLLTIERVVLPGPDVEE